MVQLHFLILDSQRVITPLEGGGMHVLALSQLFMAILVLEDLLQDRTNISVKCVRILYHFVTKTFTIVLFSVSGTGQWKFPLLNMKPLDFGAFGLDDAGLVLYPHKGA